MRKLLTTALAAVFMPLFAFSQCTNLQLSVDKQVQCAPGIVNFKITGAPTGSSYLWDFGNGFTSNTDTVYEFFINPKVVDVTVKTTFPDGTKCVTSAKKIARILAKPTISYSISRKKLCDGPDTVTLVNTTPITQSISWVVDGTNYNNSSNTLIHKFKTAGTKDINLIVTDTFGCKSVQEFKNVAIVHPDVYLDFSTPDSSGCVIKDVQFQSTINSQNEKITNTEWYFPGSNKVFVDGEVPPSIKYNKAGKYSASLTVKTENGCVHQIEKKNILNFGDSLNIKLKFEDSILCLKNSGIVQIIDPIEEANYTWSLSGHPDTTVLSGSSIKIKYDTAGEYKLEVTVNHAGCFSKWTNTRAIKVKTLEAKFESPDNYHCYIPHTVHIVNQSSSYQDVNMKYLWNIYTESGTKIRSSNSTHINHKANNWGRHTVELMAEDPYGCRDTFSYKNFIRLDTIKPTIFSEEKIGCVNQPIKLKSITPISSYLSKDTCYWVVYDEDGKEIYNQGSGNEITQTFTKPGFYDVKLYSANKIGCRDSVHRKKYIEIIEPVKNFKIVDSAICSKDSVRFNVTTSPKHARFQFSWSVYNAQNNDAFYSEPDTSRYRAIKIDKIGTYDVKYVHQINQGCKDSLIRKNALFVNGIIGNIVLNKTSGCLPLEIDASVNVTTNQHKGNSDDQVTYEWWTIPYDPSIVDDATTSHPKFTFKDKGTYIVKALIANSTSCASTSTLNYVYAGVEADFTLQQDSICVNDTVRLKNNSPLFPTSTHWEIHKDGQKLLTFNDDSISPVLSQEGLYDLKLIANKHNECYDTLVRPLNVIKVKSDFEVADTHLFCAPAYAQFNTLSVNADTFFWSFGDGSEIVTTDRSIANIYKRNTGLSKGFEVSLTSKSYLGCSDKIIKKDAIKVFGPRPDFEIKNTRGCEPLRVDFINKSSDFATYYINYDDNSDLDSTTFSHHNYNVHSSGMTQKYVPSLYIKDSLGCAAAIESKDTIVILRSPKAFPEDKEIEGCSPVQVALTDESQFSSNRRWLLNDVELSALATVSPSISTPGNHQLQLIVRNQNECYDTSSYPILVNDNPNVTINSNTLPCMNGPTEFIANPNPTTSSFIYNWLIEGQVYKSQNANVVHQFSQPGNHQIRLEIEDANGCKGSNDTVIVLNDVKDIPDGGIKRVTINDQSQLEIFWDLIPEDFIEKSTIVDNQLNNIVYQDFPNSQTMATLTTIDLKSAHCFTMHHTNFCGEEGSKSVSHCPIILNVSEGNNFELNINWSPYVGWDQVKNYIIYRSKDGSDFKKLATVDGQTLSYIDKELCNEKYFYRVEAQNEELFSMSNIDKNKPAYATNPMPMDVKVATVIENEYVQISWDTSQFVYTDHYLFSKFDATGNQLIESTELNETSIMDEDVDITNENFIYTIQTVDHCNITGEIGNHGKPIVLSGFYLDNMSQLTWTAYEQWDEGVDSYVIEIFDGNEFKEVATVPGTQTNYIDKVYHEDLNGEYNYRVIAVSFNSSVRSTSNELVVIGSSIVWVPNAFSPNEDDHNPVFRPTAQFVYLINDGTYRTYEMSIYNRWGEELFHTNNIEEGWDGTYLNKDCEPESYMYHIRINGLDRVIYDKKGLVRLMR